MSKSSVLAVVFFLIVIYILEFTFMGLLYRDQETFINVIGASNITSLPNVEIADYSGDFTTILYTPITYGQAMFSIFTFGIFLPDSVMNTGFSIVLSSINLILLLMSIMVMYIMIRSGAN